MDKNNRPSAEQNLPKIPILTRRNIFIVLGVVILAEIIWAAWMISKPAKPPQVIKPPDAITMAQPTTVSLTAAKSSISVGERLTVSINISSSKRTDGADLIITYDPNLLSAQPVIAGTIYSDYPLNSLDQALGRITVSGITDDPSGVLADGLFGSLVFVGKAPGIAKVSLQFSPGSTSDSNVTETGTGRDVLEKVEDLELIIQ